MSKTGTVKNWNEEKGFGFIGPDDGGEDLFCHVSALVGGERLDRGDTVSFDESFDERKGKTRAINVSVGGGRGSRGGGSSRGGDRYSDRDRRGGRDDDRRGGRDDYDRRGGGGRDRDDYGRGGRRGRSRSR